MLSHKIPWWIRVLGNDWLLVAVLLMPLLQYKLLCVLIWGFTLRRLRSLPHRSSSCSLPWVNKSSMILIDRWSRLMYNIVCQSQWHWGCCSATPEGATCKTHWVCESVCPRSQQIGNSQVGETGRADCGLNSPVPSVEQQHRPADEPKSLDALNTFLITYGWGRSYHLERKLPGLLAEHMHAHLTRNCPCTSQI